MSMRHLTHVSAASEDSCFGPPTNTNEKTVGLHEAAPPLCHPLIKAAITHGGLCQFFIFSVFLSKPLEWPTSEEATALQTASCIFLRSISDQPFCKRYNEQTAQRGGCTGMFLQSQNQMQRFKLEEPHWEARICPRFPLCDCSVCLSVRFTTNNVPVRHKDGRLRRPPPPLRRGGLLAGGL